jgi:hypothetical protein
MRGEGFWLNGRMGVYFMIGEHARWISKPENARKTKSGSFPSEWTYRRLESVARSQTFIESVTALQKGLVTTSGQSRLDRRQQQGATWAKRATRAASSWSIGVTSR